MNQQTTDDLRVLKATAYLTPEKSLVSNSPLHNRNARATSRLSSAHTSIQSLNGATYEVAMPIDYLHLLNCICVYYVAKQKDCWDAGTYIEVPATRLTADSWSSIITDIYNRPSPMKPYYYIHNQNTQTNNSLLPTNPITSISTTGLPNGTDMTGTYNVVSNGLAVTVVPKSSIDLTSTDDTYSYYTKIGSSWYQLHGFTYSNGKIDFTGDLNNFEVNTEMELSSDVENKLDNGSYKGAVTLMYYPDPQYTIGWSSYTKLHGKGDIDENGDEYPEDVYGYVLQNTESNTAGVGSSNFQRTFKLDTNGDGQADTTVSLVEKPIALRAGNTSNVRMEIRYGRDDTVFQLAEVQVDYVKSPQFIRLTQEQMDLTEDTSQIMEFPDYVNTEIINELVHLVMERNNDPRLGNNIEMTKSIARPTGQQAQAQA